MSDDRTQNIPVKLEDGTIILVEVTQTGREDVANEASKFKAVTEVRLVKNTDNRPIKVRG